MKGKKITGVKKNVKKILEFYYMSPKEMTAKDLSLCIQAVPEESIEVWNELNLVEVIMENDSLIFQDASSCFVDALDQDFIKGKGYQSVYQISYDEMDQVLVRRVMRDVLLKMDGAVLCDTEDFKPFYTVSNIDKLQDYK